MACATLNCMPHEIVGNIARHLEVDGCLHLAQVCHSLRAATLDALLLREVIGTQHTLWNFHSINLIRIAERHHYDAKILERYHGFALDQRRIGLWDKIAFNHAVQQHFGLDIDVWARYALADLRAFRLCAELNTQVDETGRGRYGFLNQKTFQKAMCYLPHILALKHPSIHASGLAPALATQVVKAVDSSSGPVTSAVSTRLAFAYCATMLSQDTPETPLFGASNPRAAMNAFFTNRCRDFAKRLKASTAADLAHARRHPTRISQPEAQIIIGAFSSLLRHAFREYRVSRMMGSDYYTFILPFALDVPMDHGLGKATPPLPFADEHDCAWEDWHADQILTMTSYPFLSLGQWVGCYSYTYPNTPEIDAPMMDIAFSVTAGGSTESFDPASADTTVHGTGRDSIGTFTLHGSVERTGHVMLVKTYEDGKDWDWNCAMTPFGIGGVWGPRGSEVVNGSVWLWKKDWTEGRAR